MNKGGPHMRVCIINPNIARSDHRFKTTVHPAFNGPGRLPMITVDPDQPHVGHGLLRAVHTSFAQHVPFLVGPEVILITIMQSLALLIRYTGPDIFADRFNCKVGEKKVLKVREDKLLLVEPGEGSLERSTVLWEGIFERFHTLVETDMSPIVANAASCDFSTSTTTHRAVANIVLMDVAKPFATYRMSSFCGIPEIHITGTHGDWTRLGDKISSLRAAFPELEWWWSELMPLLGQFARLSDPTEDVDCAYWQSFYKCAEASGGDSVTGHINLLYPIVTHHKTSFTENGYFTHEDIRKWGTCYSTFPHIISKVPITWEFPGGKMELEVQAGLSDVTQDANTLSVQAVPFWTMHKRV
jgi:hypothetical protein